MMKQYNFYMSDGLNVDSYDAVEHVAGTPIEGDVEFYIDWASKSAGSVLELGCGTGRVAWEIAKAGIEVVGLDLSEAMLKKAESKRADYPDDVQELADFVQGDMVDFSLDREFSLIIIPFRAWQVILNPQDQRESLLTMHRHLRQDGYLIIDIFDPRLDMCVPGESDRSRYDEVVKNSVTGNDIEIKIPLHVNDTYSQILTETWVFTEKDEAGKVIRTEEECLKMRWTYRWEMRYLFELTGFEIVAEYSDFKGSPPAYGKEQVWVVKKH